MKGLLATTLIMLLSLSALGQTKDAPAKDSDKLDLKKLEDKYWAAKDTDFSVVQNRTYTKAGRGYLSVSYGVLVNDPYSTARLTNFAAGYYFSERWGFELAHQTGQVVDNDGTSEFKSQYSVSPNYNRFKSYTSANMIWVPFYAKMSFMDRSIVYFDIQFSVGVGSRKYEIIHDSTSKNATNQTPDGNTVGNAFGYNFDFTQQLFFANHWAFRMDLKNQWANEKRERAYLSGTQTADKDLALPNNLINDSSLMLGFTYFF